MQPPTAVIKRVGVAYGCLLLVAVYSVNFVDAAVSCDSTRACFPWAAPSCTRGNSLNLRFSMDAANEYQTSTVEPDSVFNNRTITYAFCPRVDELQAFNLTGAPKYASVDPVDNTTFVTQMDDVYVSVYGFGESQTQLVPTNTSASTVMVAQNGTSLCENGNANAVLLVDFLVLQVSLTDGLFAYPGALAAWENSTGVSVQPQGVGFQPTCVDGACSLDATYKCIGPAGNQNCARCYKNAVDVSNKTIQIWVSYYGTDNNGRRMLSGASNPLNFRKYAGAGVYNTLSNSLDRVSNGESLDPSVPTV